MFYTLAINGIYQLIKFIIRADILLLVYQAVNAQISTSLSNEEKHEAVKTYILAIIEQVNAQKPDSSTISGTMIDIAIKTCLLLIRDRAAA